MSWDDFAQMSPADLRLYRQRQRRGHGKGRRAVTMEEIEARLEKENAARRKRRRAKIATETPEQRERRLAKGRRDSALYYQRHRELKKARQRAYSKAHAVEISARNRAAMTEEKREAKRARQRAWYAANREKVSARKRAWHAKNPDYARQADRDRYARDGERIRERKRRLRKCGRAAAMSQAIVDRIEGLKHALASRPSQADGVIAIDGALCAGKTTLARQVAPLLGVTHLDLDDFLAKDRRCFVGALDLERLTQAIDACERAPIVSGVCMIDVLSRIDRSAATLVYVKRMSGNRWADKNEIEGDEIEQIAAILGQQASDNPIHLEVRAYHREFQPQVRANVVFHWDSRPREA